MKNTIICAVILLLTTQQTFGQNKRRTVSKAKIKKAWNPKPKKIAVSKNEVKQVASNSQMLCNTHYGMPTWYLNNVNGFQFPTNFQNPANYRLVTINEKQLNEYLKTIQYFKSDKKITIPVYDKSIIDCKEFTIERVETMDSVLQAKYPELMSFKIYDAANMLNAGRIDCDGTSTKILLNFQGEVYYVHPVLFKGITYYACYSKNDPNFQKQIFERRK